MRGRVILVTPVGEAGGSKAAAAALACAGSEPDRACLLVDVGGRAPRPTLLASNGARKLEQRLASHLPQLPAASRGQTCHLALPAEESAVESVPAALPLVRDSVAVVHLPPGLFRATLNVPGISPTAVLLRGDLGRDRALVALAVADLSARGLTVAVLKRPLGWVSSRAALFGVLPGGDLGGVPERLVRRLLPPVGHGCYSRAHDAKADATRTAEQERRDHASAG